MDVARLRDNPTPGHHVVRLIGFVLCRQLVQLKTRGYGPIHHGKSIYRAALYHRGGVWDAQDPVLGVPYI